MTERDELGRLREINHELVCAHNDLLQVIVRLEGGTKADVAIIEAAERLVSFWESGSSLTATALMESISQAQVDLHNAVRNRRKCTA